MHCIFLIFIQILILQNALSRDITSVKGYDGQNILKGHQDVLYKDLILAENTQRGISDIWDHIKNSAKKAWNSLVILLKKNKEKVAIWVQNIKNRADAIKEELKDKLTKIITKVKSVVENVLGNENVQKCIKQNSEDLDNLLREIINNVSSCITDKVSSVSALEDRQVNVELSDAEFMEEIENKLNQCSQNAGNVEECLLNLRMDILVETEAVADELLQRKLESRNLVDDILDAVTACSTDGLIQASAVISIEAINIIQCLVQHGAPEKNVTSIIEEVESFITFRKN